MKKIDYLIAFFILLYSCSTKVQEYESFNVLYCKESSQGLHYNVSDKIITYYCCPIKPLHAALLSLNAAEILMISSNFQFQAPLE